jgi:hypothetical protein
MVTKNDRIVSQRSDDKWENKRVGASRPASLHNTQKQAEAAAKKMLKHAGGGGLITKGVDQKIRSKDTIGKQDPFPPKDKEH